MQKIKDEKYLMSNKLKETETQLKTVQDESNKQKDELNYYEEELQSFKSQVVVLQEKMEGYEQRQISDYNQVEQLNIREQQIVHEMTNLKIEINQKDKKIDEFQKDIMKQKDDILSLEGKLELKEEQFTITLEERNIFKG